MASILEQIYSDLYKVENSIKSSASLQLEEFTFYDRELSQFPTSILVCKHTWGCVHLSVDLFVHLCLPISIKTKP